MSEDTVRHALARLTASPDFCEFMSWMTRKFGYHFSSTFVDGDSAQAVYREGQRSVVVAINRLLHTKELKDE